MTFITKPKIVESFCQTLHKNVSWVSEAKLPASLPFMKSGTVIKHINMRAVGNCTVNGEELEFCDVRIFAKAPAEDKTL
jgi:hypothetical protein